jgi:hypothetical protein
MNYSIELKQIFDAYVRQEFDLFQNKDLSEMKALISLSQYYGSCFLLGDIAKNLRTPFILGAMEAKAIQSVEHIESTFNTSVVGTLKKHLDKEVAVLLSNLSSFGSNTIFPETPLSFLLVKNARTIEDLPKVALDLREEFLNFRIVMAEIEGELVADDVSLVRKQKLLRDLEALKKELWPEESFSLRKESVESTDMLGILSQICETTRGFSIDEIARLILAKPVDWILGALRRRKVRVLLRAKREFFKGQNVTNKIADLVGMKPREIQESLERERQRKKKWARSDKRPPLSIDILEHGYSTKST